MIFLKYILFLFFVGLTLTFHFEDNGWGMFISIILGLLSYAWIETDED